MPQLFIYGTLKRGYCRHVAIKGERFLGEASTQPKYQLVDLSEYPGLIKVEHSGTSIMGELWEVSERCLEQLDEIEGVDEGLYARRQIELANSTQQAVESYFYLPSTDGLPFCGSCWDKQS